MKRGWPSSPTWSAAWRPRAIPRPSCIFRAEVERQKILLNQGRFADYMLSVAEFHHALVTVTGNKTLKFLNELMLHLLAAHHVGYLRRHPQPVEARRKSLGTAHKILR